MSSLRQLFSFHGGVKPDPNKHASVQDAIFVAPVPEVVVLAMSQHAGHTAKPVVKVGQTVLRGEIIGEAVGFISSAIHASISGHVVAIEARPIAHPSGMSDTCVVIQSDGQDTAVVPTLINWQQSSVDEVCLYLQQRGVVGMGGAVFPSHAKLNFRGRECVETLVINGAECEPFMTCDDMLMRERADDVVAGACILADLLHSRDIWVGIEDNKPQAISAMRQAVIARGDPRLNVMVVPTVYPAGGAKQLVKVLTGIEIPHGRRAYDYGIQCFNVATAANVWRALAFGEAVTSRVITVAGAVGHACNIDVRLGTLVDDILALAGGLTDSAGPLIMGGPMMGFPLSSRQVPVSKATNCLLANAPTLLSEPEPEMPCIRCGDCATACPAELQPQALYWFARAQNLDKAEEYHLFDCIECGCCAYVCPSHIPLVAYYRFAKSEISAKKQEKIAADRAREQHDFRLMRLAREKAERAERLAKKSKLPKEGANMGLSAEEKKGAIQVAIDQAQSSQEPV